ncbi:MAG: tetratricopeptide repeat protein, partial [Chitinophagia bacterium]|nr:tetratricopeptide repeat protein [Chitinophagia bacterium]
ATSGGADFRSIEEKGNPSAELFYNLGNCYYKLNSVGLAVLYYEKALKIDPDNKNAKDNLLLAESRIVNKVAAPPDIFFIQWRQSATHPIHARQWAITAIIIFFAILGIFSYNSFRKSDKKPLPVQAAGVLILLWIFVFLLAYTAETNAKSQNQAIVLQGNTTLLMTNDTKKSKTAPNNQLPEGTKVKILSANPEYAEVLLTDGRKGWVANNAIKRF